MEINLSPEQEAFVNSLVESGRYPDVISVLEAAMKLLDEDDERRARAKEEEK